MRWYGSLRRSSEIAFVRRRGRSFTGRTLSGFGAPGAGSARVAVTVSKAVGNAVVRNKVRRRIRAALDGLETRPGMRFVFVAKPASAGEAYRAVAAEVEEAVRRLAMPG